MLIARTVAKETIRYEDVPEPALEPGHALVRVHNVTLCGTDLHIWEDDYPAGLPVIQGHEFTGIVEAIANNDAGIRAGDRVAVSPMVYCGTVPAVPPWPVQRLREHRLHRLLFGRRARGADQRAG